MSWSGQSQLAETNRLLRLKEQTLRLAQHFGGAGTWDWEIASGRLIWSDCYGSIDCLDAGTDSGNIFRLDRDPIS